MLKIKNQNKIKCLINKTEEREEKIEPTTANIISHKIHSLISISIHAHCAQQILNAVCLFIIMNKKRKNMSELIFKSNTPTIESERKRKKIYIKKNAEIPEKNLMEAYPRKGQA